MANEDRNIWDVLTAWGFGLFVLAAGALFLIYGLMVSNEGNREQDRLIQVCVDTPIERVDDCVNAWNNAFNPEEDD